MIAIRNNTETAKTVEKLNEIRKAARTFLQAMESLDSLIEDECYGLAVINAQIDDVKGHARIIRLRTHEAIGSSDE